MRAVPGRVSTAEARLAPGRVVSRTGSRGKAQMKDRRSFLRMLAVGCVALAVVVAPAIADELFGVISKVDVAGKKVTVIEKDTDKEVIISVTDNTEYVTGKGSSKLDL